MAKKARMGVVQMIPRRQPLVQIKTGPACEMAAITPELAAAWLERNTDNRRVAQARVDQYASEMRDGRWRSTHQGIAFDEDGRLADGQHRLWAIIESGVTVTMPVFRGISREAMLCIDTGRPRSDADAFKFMGDDASHTTVSVARVLYAIYRHNRGADLNVTATVSRHTLRLFHAEMAEAITFSAVNSKLRGLRHACVSGAIASAWFTQPRAALERFKDCYATGVVSGQHESAVVALRDFVASSAAIRGGRSGRTDLLLRASNAIRHFVDGNEVHRLHGRESALFQIPDVAGV